mgnify:CR=1 FL=1
MIACAPEMDERGRKQVFRTFERQVNGSAECGMRNADQTESEMPLSTEDFARMMKDERAAD